MAHFRSQFILFLIASVFTAASCTSLQKVVCAKGNWETIGRNDAQKGLDTRIKEYNAVCKGENSVDVRAYVKGFANGRASYCSRENGKLVGLQGEPYRHNCPLHLESDFLRGYNAGREQFEFRDALVRSSRRAEEQRQREFRAFRTSLVERENRSCTFNSDCNTPARCERDRCENSGKSCYFDSDCTIQGRCIVNRCSRY